MIFLRSSPAWFTKLMIFSPITGNTQGIRLRIKPPNNMPPSTTKNLKKPSDSGTLPPFTAGVPLPPAPALASFPIRVSGMSTAKPSAAPTFSPTRIPESESPCGIACSNMSLVARLTVMTQSAPSLATLPPALIGWRNFSFGMNSAGAPAGGVEPAFGLSRIATSSPLG